MQKKSYKILDTLLENGQNEGEDNEAGKKVNNEAICAFVSEQFESIASTLASSLSECASGAKVPRLKCLNALMAYVSCHQPGHKLLVRKMLPEVILSIREVNQKSRDASLALLNVMLKLWQRMGAQANPAISDAGN